MFQQLCQLTKTNELTKSNELTKTNELTKSNELTETDKVEEKERLNWDEYFMSIALLASQRSPCKRLHVGSVIVRDNRLISMGYNGYIAGAPHISRLKDDHEQSIIHSEVNAVSDCAKRGASLADAKIYITHYPCLNCFRTIASCGIKEIIYLDDYKNDELVKELSTDANMVIRKL